MKKIIIPIIVIVILAGLILGGYLMIDSLFPKADPINVPSASSVVSMTVKKNENRNDGDLREIANADVDSILSKLSEAEPTRKMSVQDSPDAKTYYEIAVKTNERTHYFYVYFENGDCYVEIPYEGIYTVDKGIILERVIGCKTALVLKGARAIFQNIVLEFQTFVVYVSEGA